MESEGAFLHCKIYKWYKKGHFHTVKSIHIVRRGILKPIHSVLGGGILHCKIYTWYKEGDFYTEKYIHGVRRGIFTL